MAVLVTLLGAVLALVVVLVAGLLRSHAEILRVLEAQGFDLEGSSSNPEGASRRARPNPPQRAASDISGVSPEGDAVRIAVVGTQHPTLVAFLTSGCTTCVGFWNSFARPSDASPPNDARVVVVTKGAEAESPGRLRRFTTVDVPVVMSSEAWEAYDVPVAPYFAYVDGPSGIVVGEGAAMTWTQLVSMMEQALADAGMERTRTTRRRRQNGRERSERIDHDLQAGGIEPGHPSLYPTSVDDLVDMPELSDEGAGHE
jgi:hypothetical protein